MIINGLKWLVKFLETRFPEKVNPASKEEMKAAHDVFVMRLELQRDDINALKVQIEKMEKHIEVLNLRVGLSRPTQSAFGRKLNG